MDTLQVPHFSNPAGGPCRAAGIVTGDHAGTRPAGA